VVANPKGGLRPGQFVRARAKGAMRPGAIVVPQRAVLQGAKSHFVWVIDKEGKAEQRMVEAGQWNGDEWFINKGLKPGERIVVDGAIRVTAGAALKVSDAAPAKVPATEQPPADPKSAAAAHKENGLDLRMSTRTQN
jgi:membrane fusion protein, multidrug efflux system